MGKIADRDSSQLAEAILVWTGWKTEMLPIRDDSRLVVRFGKEVAAKLLRVIKSLEDDFYLSDAKSRASDLQEMERLSIEDFKRSHPEVAEEIGRALAWCYTFDFK